MTGPTLLLSALLAHGLPAADEPKPAPNAPATEVEGAWRECQPPDAKGGPRATFSFTRNAVVIDLYGQQMRGEFTTEPHWPLSVMVLDVNTGDGKRFHVTGVCRRQGDALYLKLAPEDAADPPVGVKPGLLGLAPLVISLERVEK